ncbi:hypothetical protein [Kosmotoga pacifica]|uniref:DUF5667 domain-containing protein n=1 Tax=Kosmotoga pacifica TaxID=1330330 RepID=A0A0G2Z7D8_9BACT|nr:hypothetical protein [Kosmotoga pacifica]AKI97457.1 hypothetical protein IX53_06080 [Kosmotoga pacifica]
MRKAFAFFMIILLSVTAVLAASPFVERAPNPDVVKLEMSIKILRVFREIGLTKEQAAKLYEGLEDIRGTIEELMEKRVNFLEEFKRALIDGDREQIERINARLKELEKNFVKIRESVELLFKENITVAQAEKLEKILQREFNERLQRMGVRPEVLKEKIEHFRKTPEELMDRIPEAMKQRLRNMSPEERAEAIKNMEARFKEAKANLKQQLPEIRKRAFERIGRFIFSPIFLDTLREYAGIE